MAANNDAPTGAARIPLVVSLPAGWETYATSSTPLLPQSRAAKHYVQRQRNVEVWAGRAALLCQCLCLSLFCAAAVVCTGLAVPKQDMTARSPC